MHIHTYGMYVCVYIVAVYVCCLLNNYNSWTVFKFTIYLYIFICVHVCMYMSV